MATYVVPAGWRREIQVFHSAPVPEYWLACHTGRRDERILGHTDVVPQRSPVYTPVPALSSSFGLIEFAASEGSWYAA